MKTAAQIWLDYGRSLNVGATEKALADLDAEIVRLRTAFFDQDECYDLFISVDNHVRSTYAFGRTPSAELLALRERLLPFYRSQRTNEQTAPKNEKPSELLTNRTSAKR